MAKLSVSGDVDPAADVVALVAALGRADLGRDLAREAADVRLVGDVVDRAGLRARAEQRALRARQRLDALDVDQAHVGLLRDRGHRLVVEVDRDLAVDAEFAGAGPEAAHDDDALARHVADEVDGGEGADQVVGVRQCLLLDELGGERRDALRDVLQVLAAPRRGDGDGLESRWLRCRRSCARPAMPDTALRKSRQPAASSGRSSVVPPIHAQVSDRCNTLNERTTKSPRKRV